MQTTPTSPSPSLFATQRAASQRARTSPRRPRSERSLASQLERDRLEQRVTRVRLVIGALRERADAREGNAPRPLRAAIEDFGRELAELERQLRRAGGRLGTR